QMLARDTPEGVARYTNNKFSSERRPQKRLRFTLIEGEETGDLGGAVVEGVDPTTGNLLQIATQLHIKNRTTAKTDIFVRGKGPILLSDSDHGIPGERELFIIAPSKELHDQFAEELKGLGVILKDGEPLGLPNALQGSNPPDHFTLPVHVETEVDDTHKR